MKMEIKQAIIHSLNAETGSLLCSQKTIDADDNVTMQYIAKHMERFANDSEVINSSVELGSDSMSFLRRYLDNEVSLVDLSISFAEAIFSFINKRGKGSSEYIFCELLMEDKKCFGVLECDNKKGFTHYITNNTNIVYNQIIQHHSILPATSQRLASCALINLSTWEAAYYEKPEYIDGNDIYVLRDKVLNLQKSISPKETVRKVKGIVSQLANQYGKNEAIAISQAKTYIAEKTEISSNLNTLELGMDLFCDSPAMQKEYIEQAKKAGLPDAITIKKEQAQKSTRVHKFSTDNGIEVTLPVDYLGNKDIVEFVNMPDGTISIQLKNIVSIKNK